MSIYAAMVIGVWFYTAQICSSEGVTDFGYTVIHRRAYVVTTLAIGMHVLEAMYGN